MESKGFITGISRDYFSKRYVLSIALEGVNQAEIETLDNSHPYRIKISKWAEKRSLDANSYFWVIASKMAEVVKTSKDEMYEQLLQRYGLLDEDVVITVKSSVDMAKVEGHWKFLKSDGKWSGYIRIRGTSEYDSREMAHFLDMVVEEAKELGVETLPADELRRMMDEIGTSKK